MEGGPGKMTELTARGGIYAEMGRGKSHVVMMLMSRRYPRLNGITVGVCYLPNTNSRQEVVYGPHWTYSYSLSR